MSITRITVLPRDRTLDPTIAQMQREINALCLQVVRYEDTIVELRREVARLHAQEAVAPRKAPIWLLPFAYVGLAWGAYNDTYCYESKEEGR